MKKIAIVSSLPAWEASVPYAKPEHVGHYTVWISTVCKALENQHEYEIHWLILDKTVKKERTIETRGQVFHILPKARLTVGLYTAYAYDTYIILKTLHRIKPDLVHTWGTENSYSFACSHYKGNKLLSIQGLLKAYSERARIVRFERQQALYEIYTIKKYKHITTESPWATDRVREIAPSAVPYHLEYAVESEFFSTQHVLDDTPVCLYGGTNTPVKNVATLIKAFSCPELSHIKLALAGVSSAAYPNATSNILFMGRINRQEMIKQMSRAWCLVHPSLADTGPTIAKEARVMGLPVMMTTECGSVQHIEEGKSGFIVKPYDVEAMRDSILKMTESKEKAIAMGAHGQSDCRKKLSEATMIHRLLEIYANIIS